MAPRSLKRKARPHRRAFSTLSGYLPARPPNPAGKSLNSAYSWAIWAQAAEPVTVIAPFNLTGPEAVLDAPCYKGAALAVEKLNAAGGVLGRPIQLVPVDTASEASSTTNSVDNALAILMAFGHAGHIVMLNSSGFWLGMCLFERDGPIDLRLA